MDPNMTAAPTANDELGDITAEIDALLGAAPPAPGGGATSLDPSAMGAVEPDASPEDAPAAGAPDAEVQPLVDGLNLTPEKARELYDAAQVYPPTQGMDPATLADALNSDARLMSELMMQTAGAEEAPDEQAMFSLGGPANAPEIESDEPPEVDSSVEDALK